MSVRLPKSLLVLERGWLSSNCILGLDADSASVIDTGYVTHASHTVHLLGYLLGQANRPRHLARIINTHVHSDHMGGNAAVQKALGGSILIPVASQSMVSAWDEEALLLSNAGQEAAPFQADGSLAAGDRFEFGALEWEAVPVPGHDAAMLAFYCADEGVLISADALWEKGFGILFPAVFGDRSAFSTARETLARLGRLSVRAVIPGHGPPFADVDGALKEAEARLAAQEASADRMARHALKALLMFRLLDLRRLALDELPAFLDRLPIAHLLNNEFLGREPMDRLAQKLAEDLVRVGAVWLEQGVLSPR